MSATETDLATWERRTEWPLMGLAIIFLIAYAAPILAPDLPPRFQITCQALTWLVWALFAADYLARWKLSTDRRRFLRVNMLNLIVIVLPLLRPLRMVRLLTLLDVLNRSAATSLRGRVAVYVASTTIMILFLSALAVLDAERADPDSNIRSFPDAIWWAATTVTTVGYGDRYPVTAEGRTVAALLMIGGVALLGIVTASLAAWLIERVREVEAEAQAATSQDIHRLLERLDRLQDEVQRLRSRHDGKEHRDSAPGQGHPVIPSQD